MVALEDVVWKSILSLYHHPRITRPEIHETISTIPEVLKDELAGYLIQERTIHVNKPKLSSIKGYSDAWIIPVVAHEVGHHALCPYSPAVALRLTSAAQSVVRDWHAAQHIENLFDDMIVNTFIFRNDRSIGDGLVEVLSKMSELKSCPSGQLYLRSYEFLWDLPVGTLVEIVSDKIEKDAFNIASILSDATFMSETWERKIKNFAEIFGKYLQGSHSGCRARGPEEYGSVIPALQELARELPIGRLKEIAVGLNICSAEFAEKLFYLGHARNYSLQLPKSRTRRGEGFPVSPVVWQPSDPTNRLNIPYSLQRSGVLIPGVTTQQWTFEQGENFAEEEGHPDLCIIMDSSGSMPDGTKGLSYPVLSGVVASESALNAGCRVAVVNFSSEGESDFVDYTLDRDKILSGLLKRFGRSTFFPCEGFLSLIKSSSHAQHILMMSDGEVHNGDNWVDTMSKAYRHCGSGTLFLATSGSEKGWKAHVSELRSVGYRIWPMSTNNDLLAVVQADAQELYG